MGILYNLNVNILQLNQANWYTNLPDFETTSKYLAFLKVFKHAISNVNPQIN